jgi:hypothetical protein
MNGREELKAFVRFLGFVDLEYFDDSEICGKGMIYFMARHKLTSQQREAGKFRSQRIGKLIEQGWIRDAAEIPDEAIPVDPDLVNFGGSYQRPIFYSDRTFTCEDCDTYCVWKAEDQRWYFETSRAPFYVTAKRCLDCRRKERRRKHQTRIDSGHISPSEDAESSGR